MDFKDIISRKYVDQKQLFERTYWSIVADGLVYELCEIET